MIIKRGMKKLLAILLVLYFSQLIFVRSVFAAASGVNYALPYPGLLPDSPVYFLKVARDNFMLMIIRDPIQKSFYELLLADKRLAAGKTLIEAGKVPLGVTTISKAEDYFRLSVEQDLNLKSPKSSDLTAKLVVSASKHAEVISNLLPKTTGTNFNNLQKAYQINQDNQKRVTNFVLTPSHQP